ncbi:MAG: VWA domain-containing protein [marine benthic group bacterium]|nr:VWA domain-containing protein [Gemmatimonadota bacterium]MCL7969054.1 VWA domain-containing protein [Gemmatimonadota bacterium]
MISSASGSLVSSAAWWPWAAAVAASLVALGLRAAAVRLARRDRERLGDARVLGEVSQPPSRFGQLTRLVLLAVGVGSLAAVLAGADDSEAGSGEGRAGAFEVVLVLDASNSMLAEDVSPSRVGQQREVARRLVSEIDGRFGIVYFAGGGYVLSPLTDDRDAALMFAETVDPSLVGRGGTSLPAGLVQGMAVLGGGQPRTPRAIVVLSDGESTVDTRELDGVLATASAAGVAVHAVGFGTTEGGRIPMPIRQLGDPLESAEALGVRPDMGANGRAWLRDSDGLPVVSRLEEESLRRVASETGGLYVQATESGIDALLARLPRSADETGAGSAVPLLLMLAFGALFAEAYLFRRA